MPLYPNITPDIETAIKVVYEQITADPNYLRHNDCPYSKDLKTILNLFAMERAGEGGPSDKDLATDDALLLDEIIDTYNDLKTSKPKDDDAAALMSYFRTRTSLLEKLVSLREVTNNAASFVKFRQIIMGLMEEYLTEDQRADMLARLQKADG